MDALSLTTPAVYIDLDILERNLSRMQERCRTWKVGLRPHTKMHKIPEIARMQLALGAVGITVAKISEAEVMPGDDVLIAYPLMPEKLPRLRTLAKTKRVIVTVDSVEMARAVGDIETLVEVDIGFHRCGVQSVEEFMRVADACAGYRGIFYYPAGLGPEQLRRGAQFLAACIAARPGPIVSGGSTPNAVNTPLFPSTTEIRTGTYAFNDASVVAIGVAKPEDCALRILTTVVSTAVSGQCIIDAGSKTISLNPTKVVLGYGQFIDRPWTLDNLNEEHGYANLAGSSARVGEKVWLIPGHAGTCVNLHNEIAYGREGRVEGTWTVATRGLIR